MTARSLIAAALALAAFAALPAKPAAAQQSVADFYKGKQLRFIIRSEGFAVGQPIGAGPGIPAGRLAALRKAFDDTMVDPAFVAAAQKNGTDLKPMTGAELAHLIDDLLGAPQAIKDKVRSVMPERT